MKRALSLFITLCLPVAAFAADSGHQHSAGMNHAAHAMPAGATPQAPAEAGQSAFAAIQEIVALLMKDPTTDWSTVDIEKLRRHLADMDNVTLRSDVKSEAIPTGARFTVTGQGAVRDSIRRMVSAHAQTMDGVNGWRFSAEDAGDGAVLTVTVTDPKDIAVVRALGFIGVMTVGAHHQRHHLMIATGRGHD